MKLTENELQQASFPSLTMNQQQPTSQNVLAHLTKAALALVTIGMFTLVGCSSDKDLKPIEHKPSKLPALTVPFQTLALVWKDYIGKEEKLDPLRPQLDTVDGNIYAASRNGRLYAWTATGHPLWQIRTKDEITSGVVAAQGIVVYGTTKGNLVARSSKDGKFLWVRQTGSSILAPALISGNRVVAFSNDGTLTGTDIATGQSAWVYDISMPPLTVRGSAAPVLFDENTVIVGGGSGRINAFDIATGVPKWERRVAVSSGTSEVQRLIDIDGDPLISGRQLYAVSYQGQVTALNLDSQQVNWVVDASSLKSLAEGLGNIYVSTVDGNIMAIDEQSGKVQWTQDKLAYRHLSNPVILGRYLVVGDADGYIHLIEQTEGKIVGRVQTKGAITYLHVVGDRLLVETAKGALSVWQVR